MSADDDDTVNRILSLMGKRRAATLAAPGSSGGKEPAPVGGEVSPLYAEAAAVGGEATAVGKSSLDPKRTGIFTSGIVSTWEGHQAVIFFNGTPTGRGKSADVLGFRSKERELPIQLCDPSPNMPADLATILANCLAHGRRPFADVAECFPQECSYVLHALKGVYKNDELARRDELSPEERPKFHQTHSEPIMKDFSSSGSSGSSTSGWWSRTRPWAERLRIYSGTGIRSRCSFGKRVGPWTTTSGEWAWKKVLLHRKNSLFYKTENGAGIGDLFTSLIHTCERGFKKKKKYFHQLVRHQGTLARNPAAWMPWNYRQTVESLGNSPLPQTAPALES